ncbi:MAG: hypothetical protein MZV63_32870 [Marinilabiliales bacterium]|nr:hypothetical protein [Marinilabiliales bacterium]
MTARISIAGISSRPFPVTPHDGNTLELNYLFMSLYRMILRAIAIDVVEQWAPTASSDISLAQRLTGEMEFLKALPTSPL